MNPYATKFVKSSEKKQYMADLEKHYGITVMPYLLIEAGKQHIRGFSGHMNKEEIVEFAKYTTVDTIGLYLFSTREHIPRPSFDALPLFKSQITKNIIELNQAQLSLWLRGNDLEMELPTGYYIMKYKDDLIGVGRASGIKLSNYVPRERTLKSQKIQRFEKPQVSQEVTSD